MKNAIYHCVYVNKIFHSGLIPATNIKHTLACDSK